MSNVYLAMYKAKGNWMDSLIRFFTGKPYSHCEIFIKDSYATPNKASESNPKAQTLALTEIPFYWAFTSSPRDGGVRCKMIKLSNYKKDNWDLIPLKNVKCEQINALYQRTKGKKYDFLGAIGCVLPLREKPSRYYCSEWCYEAIFGESPEKALSPNLLAQIVKKNGMIC